MENEKIKGYIKELESNPTVQEWLSQFEHGNKDAFIEEYAELKHSLEKNPPRSETEDSYKTKHIDVAKEAIEAILSKKIFDMYLLWSAKQINIEGVDISMDIERWFHFPRNCPFVPNITDEEIELMKKFLLSDNYEEYKLSSFKQLDFDDVRKQLKDKTYDTEWLRFYNEHISNPVSTDLPDLIGKKEKYYLDYNTDSSNEKNTDKKEEYKPTKYIDMYERFDLIEKLARALSLDEFSDYVRDKTYFAKGKNPVDSDYAWYYLNTHYYETAPLMAHENWAKSLKLSYEKLAARLAAKSLKAEVEAYHFKKECNIVEKNKFDPFDRITEMYREKILYVREKLGEPKNFDY